MNDSLRSVRDFFVSLKLTVVLLALGMVLVFFSTLDQVHLGIWGIQEKWFRSFVVVHDTGGSRVPVFPGGYLIGGLLLVNLISAHLYRLKLVWRKAGIQLIHSGVIVLLVGELITGILQEDFQMTIVEGASRNYSESFRDYEVAIVDVSNPAYDDVVAIPDAVFSHGGEIQHAKIPFRVVPQFYFPNSSARPRAQVPNAPRVGATHGELDARFVVTEQAIDYSQNGRNIPTALVALVATEGTIGKWLLRPEIPVMRPGEGGAPQLDIDRTAPERFTYGGRTFEMSLRLVRAYKPFSIRLLKVTHDNYVGTDLPKNFSSRVELKTPDGRDDREVLIYMNNPLRYGGYTFYQHQMEAARGLTGLQVVRNPGWLLPYIACVMMTLGLVLQFGLSLFAFNAKRRAKAAAQPKAA